MDMICNKITDDGYFGNTLLEVSKSARFFVISLWKTVKYTMKKQIWTKYCLLGFIAFIGQFGFFL